MIEEDGGSESKIGEKLWVRIEGGKSRRSWQQSFIVSQQKARKKWRMVSAKVLEVEKEKKLKVSRPCLHRGVRHGDMGQTFSGKAVKIIQNHKNEKKRDPECD